MYTLIGCGYARSVEDHIVLNLSCSGTRSLAPAVQNIRGFLNPHSAGYVRSHFNSCAMFAMLAPL
eukprot:10072218-Alexandrium_andersonii.AAC.1